MSNYRLLVGILQNSRRRLRRRSELPDQQQQHGYGRRWGRLWFWKGQGLLRTSAWGQNKLSFEWTSPCSTKILQIICCEGRISTGPKPDQYKLVRPGDDCKWQYANYGERLQCGDKQAIFGRCGSGRDADCVERRKPGLMRNWYHGIQCCTMVSDWYIKQLQLVMTRWIKMHSVPLAKALRIRTY